MLMIDLVDPVCRETVHSSQELVEALAERRSCVHNARICSCTVSIKGPYLAVMRGVVSEELATPVLCYRIPIEGGQTIQTSLVHHGTLTDILLKMIDELLKDCAEVIVEGRIEYLVGNAVEIRLLAIVQARVLRVGSLSTLDYAVS